MFDCFNADVKVKWTTFKGSVSAKTVFSPFCNGVNYCLLEQTPFQKGLGMHGIKQGYKIPEKSTMYVQFPWSKEQISVEIIISSFTRKKTSLIMLLGNLRYIHVH